MLKIHIDRTVHTAFGGKVYYMHRLELRKHAFELVLVADVGLLEFELVGFCDRSQIFKIARASELAHYADGVQHVIDDVLQPTR